MLIEFGLAELLRDMTTIFESGYFKQGMGALVFEAQKQMVTILRP